jgi:hypothetical protein
MKKNIKTFIAFALMGVCCSCSPSRRLAKPNPVDCEKVLPSAILQIRFEPQPVDQLVVQVSQAFAISNTEILVSGTADEQANYIIWENQNLNYSLEPHHDGRMRLLIETLTPSAGALVSEVLTCMGTPDYYTAFYGSRMPGFTFEFELLYLKRGVTFIASKTQREQPKDPLSMRVSNIIVVKGGDLDQVMKNSYYAADVGVPQKTRWKLWPGDISKIVIGTE